MKKMLLLSLICFSVGPVYSMFLKYGWPEAHYQLYNSATTDHFEVAKTWFEQNGKLVNTANEKIECYFDPSSVTHETIDGIERKFTHKIVIELSSRDLDKPIRCAVERDKQVHPGDYRVWIKSKEWLARVLSKDEASKYELFATADIERHRCLSDDEKCFSLSKIRIKETGALFCLISGEDLSNSTELHSLIQKLKIPDEFFIWGILHPAELALWDHDEKELVHPKLDDFRATDDELNEISQGISMLGLDAE